MKRGERRWENVIDVDFLGLMDDALLLKGGTGRRAQNEDLERFRVSVSRSKKRNQLKFNNN